MWFSTTTNTNDHRQCTKKAGDDITSLDSYTYNYFLWVAGGGLISNNLYLWYDTYCYEELLTQQAELLLLNYLS